MDRKLVTYYTNTHHYIDIIRPKNVVAMWLAFTVGSLITGSVPLAGFVLGLAILFLIHSAGTLQNDVVDYAVDKSNKVDSVLQNKQLSVNVANYLAIFLYALALLTARYTPSQSGYHLAFACTLVLLCWLYNVPPVRLSHRPIASIIILGLFYSAVPMAYGALLAGASIRLAVGLAIIWGVLRASTSIMKDYKDVAGDRLHHKKTFLLAYGKKVTAITGVALGLLGYGGATVWLGWSYSRAGWGLLFALGALLAAGWGIVLRTKILSATISESKLIFRRSFVVNNLFELGVIGCLLLSSAR